MDDRPNILLVMVDEHAPQASSVYGHPYVRTPYLDDLAARGVVFEQAYCPSPLCVPSRMSFMTGNPVHRTGVYDNSAPLASDVPTFAHTLAAAGYETVLAGKMHFVGPDQLHGFERRLIEDCCDQTMWTVPSWDEGIGTAPGALQRLVQAGPDDQAIANVYDDLVEQRAMAFLSESKKNQQRPFLLVASFNAPHFPLTPRKRFFDEYADQVTMPRVAPPGASPLHPTDEGLRRYFGLEGVADEMVRRARAAYFGLVTQTDERFGHLMETVGDHGTDRPTIVIYLADHGEMMGEHGLWWKCTFYEEAVRVPLIMAWPGIFPPRREHMPVSLTDMARTLAALAHADVGESPGEGLDLVPFLKGQCGDLERPVWSEYHAHGVLHSKRMVRQGRFKLVYTVGQKAQLYDILGDPYEWYDLSDVPEHRDTRFRLERLALSGWPQLMEEHVRASQRQRQVIAKANRAMPGRGLHPWSAMGGG